MKPQLSIVMPVKNTAPYLQECLDSIINQTFTDWELLAVDDHSSDTSLDILKKNALQDQRIRVLKNEGEGIVTALRLVYASAKGNFITRMDSDDINELRKYEKMIAQLRQSGVGYIALGQVKYFSEKGIEDGYKKYESWLNKLISAGNCFDEIYRECVVPSPCWMLHKEDLECIGGLAALQVPEDYDLAFRLYKARLKCLPSQEVLFRWRDSENRTSRTHPDYTNEKILSLKCHYFLDIDFESEKNLVLWGAGSRGKFIAQYLAKQKVPFTWVCNNKNKIGHDIYGVFLRSVEELKGIQNKQIIVSVANNQERLAISEECEINGWENYLFC